MSPITEQAAKTIATLDHLANEGADETQREWIVEIVKKTDCPQIRNAAAIAMSDLRIQGAEGVLIELLKRPDTEKHRGTLLYALDELGGSLPLPLAVALLQNECYEGREETLLLLGKGRVIATEAERHAALPSLRHLAKSPDEYTASVGERAIEWLSLS